MFTSFFRSGAIAMALLAACAFAGQALAADTSNAPAAAVQKPNMDRLTATGSIVATHEMKANKQIDHYNLRVKEAKNPAGKLVPSWSGKSLQITGAKLADAKKLDGKQVEVTGISHDGKTIDVSMIREMPAAAKPAPAANPAPAPSTSSAK